MNVALISNSLTVFLSPFLPYLLKVGEKAVEDVGSKFGAATWEKAKVLWTKLKPKFAAKAAAMEAAEDVGQAPDDEDAQASLRLQLKKLLTQDEALATEIAELMQEKQETPGSTNISQQAGDDAIMFGQVKQGRDINVQR